eukprot:Rhum_TRINITY_DN14714_c7_g1::Rhum_TRINITY_DN14714_c7_g1_i1::g.113336::m.113336
MFAPPTLFEKLWEGQELGSGEMLSLLALVTAVTVALTFIVLTAKVSIDSRAAKAQAQRMAAAAAAAAAAGACCGLMVDSDDEEGCDVEVAVRVLFSRFGDEEAVGDASWNGCGGGDGVLQS